MRKLLSGALRLLNRMVGRGKPKTEDKDRLQQEYFNTGLHYHIAGRFAVIAGFIPVAGNLFHHAVEMYLKGALCRTLDEDERRKLRHRLKNIWTRFKTEYSDPALNQFDQAIWELDRFERIRYPEEIINHGMISTIGFVRNMPILPSAPKRAEPRYELVVDDLDAFAKVIFEKASINPKFFTSSLRQDALKYLQNQNQSAIW